MALALAGLLAAGCGGGGSAEGGMALGEGGGGGRLVLMTQRGEGLPRLLGVEGDEVHLQSSSQTQTLNVILLNGEVVAASRSVTIDPQASTQQIVLEELPVGTFQLVIEFVDSSGHAFAFFNTQVTLVAGEITRVTLSPSSSPSPSASPLTASGFVYVANLGGNTITAYQFLNGILSTVTGSPFGNGGLGPSRLAMDPSGSLLFASNPGANAITSHLVNPTTGQLSLADTEPALNPGVTGGLASHPTLQVLYVGLPSVQQKIQWFSYSTGTGLLTPAGSLPVLAPEGSTDVVPDPGGSFLYGSGINLSSLSIDGSGNVTGIASTHPTNNAAIFSATLLKGGRTLLYSSVSNSPNHEVVKHESTAGVLGADQTVVLTSLPTPVTGLPRGIAAHPSGNHLYVAADTHIVVFDVAADGTMSFSEAEAVASNGARAVQVDPTGQFLVCAQSLGGAVPGNVLVYQVSPTTGQITLFGSGATGNSPADILFAP